MKHFITLLVVFLIVAMPLNVNSAESGTIKAQARIVGGVESEPGSWPFMAVLVLKDKNPYYGILCGAALINPYYALTAAHCVTGSSGLAKNPSDIDVVLGLHNLMTDAGERFEINRILVHPDYDPGPEYNDIAVIELKKSASSYSYALLPDPDNLYTNVTATVMGFGYEKWQRKISEVLREVDVPVQPNEKCKVNFESLSWDITDDMLCAGYDEGGKDACIGDSGGPLVVSGDGGAVLVGIVSFGEECALPEYFGVYTRVTSYLEWIGLIMGGNPEDCDTAYLKGYDAGFAEGSKMIADTDDDGVPDIKDECPDTEPGAATYKNGCSAPLDTGGCALVDESYNITVPCFVFGEYTGKASLKSHYNSDVLKMFYWTVEE